MSSGLEIRPPETTAELRSELARLQAAITATVDDLPTDEFVARQGEYWSPAEHLRHLATAVAALVAGLETPKILLALRFGVTFRGSRSFESVRDQYRAALANGGKASGRWDPSERDLGMADRELRDFVMARWQRVGESLDRGLDGWGDAALDRFRARHPLLGLMTIRELLFFTLYHNARHARRVVERRS